MGFLQSLLVLMCSHKAYIHRPRPHENDAGADVYMPYDCTLKPGEIARIPLGFGLMIPDGYAGYVFPRSSMAAKGLVCFSEIQNKVGD